MSRHSTITLDDKTDKLLRDKRSALALSVSELIRRAVWLTYGDGQPVPEVRTGRPRGKSAERKALEAIKAEQTGCADLFCDTCKGPWTVPAELKDAFVAIRTGGPVFRAR